MRTFKSVDMMLICHIYLFPDSPPNLDSHSIQDSSEFLIRKNLIDRQGERLDITERGMRFVKHICKIADLQ